MRKSVKTIVENGVKNVKIVKNCQIIVKNVTKCMKLVAIILSMEKVQKTYFWGFKVLKKDNNNNKTFYIFWSLWLQQWSQKLCVVLEKRRFFNKYIVSWVKFDKKSLSAKVKFISEPNNEEMSDKDNRNARKYGISLT